MDAVNSVTPPPSPSTLSVAGELWTALTGTELRILCCQMQATIAQLRGELEDVKYECDRLKYTHGHVDHESLCTDSVVCTKSSEPNPKLNRAAAAYLIAVKPAFNYDAREYIREKLIARGHTDASFSCPDDAPFERCVELMLRGGFTVENIKKHILLKDEIYRHREVVGELCDICMHTE
jgi:hypothetical protein